MEIPKHKLHLFEQDIYNPKCISEFAISKYNIFLMFI